MDSVFSISILASVLGLIGYSLCFLLGKKKRRAQQLTHRAGDYGFRFEGDIDTTPREKFALLRLFSFHVPGQMKNILTRNSPSIWIFDYEYSIPRDQDVGQTVAMIEMCRNRWPASVIESRKKNALRLRPCGC